MAGLPQWRESVVQHWRSLLQQLREPYRPELHYMRGPGPKWRAKHQDRTDTHPAIRLA